MTYFLDVYGYTRTTGDLAPWEPLASPDCRWCTEVTNIVVRLHQQQGGWIEGGAFVYEDDAALVAYPSQDFDSYVVRMPVVEQPYVVHLPRETHEDPGGEFPNAQIAVRHVGGTYVVTGVRFDG